MSRRLIAYVHIGGVAYGPGDDMPQSVAEQIGDHCWEDIDTDTQDGDGGVPGGAPPRSGRGSGLDAWLAFATQAEVGTAPDMSRDDVIAACEAAGVIDREE
jgi:hypothetical protein